jgi:hypothetical protein
MIEPNEQKGGTNESKHHAESSPTLATSVGAFDWDKLDGPFT